MSQSRTSESSTNDDEATHLTADHARPATSSARGASRTPVSNEDVELRSMNGGDFLLQTSVDGTQAVTPLKTKGKAMGLAYRCSQYWKQTRGEIGKKKGTYFLGLFCVFLVVMIVSVADNALANTPVVFLNLARGQEGDIDLQMLVSSSMGPSFFNSTRVSEILGQEDFRVAPRIALGGFLVADSEERRQIAPDPFVRNNTWLFNSSYFPASVRPDEEEAEICERFGVCYEYLLGPSIGVSMYAVDAAAEIKADLGVELQMTEEIAPTDTWITTSVANQLKVKEGDIVFLRLTISQEPFISAVFEASAGFNWTATDVRDLVFKWKAALIPYTVRKIFKEPLGKFKDDITSSVMISLRSFWSRLSTSLHPEIPSSVPKGLSLLTGLSHSSTLIVNMSPPRARVYADSDFDRILGRVNSFVSRAMYLSGFDQMVIETPLLRAMFETRFFSLFLGLLVAIIVWVLSGLSILLISSLLTVSVETRTFELGVLRMIGMRRRWVVELLIMQALSFSIPAWTMGLIAAQVIASLLSRTVFSSAGEAVKPLLRPSSIALSTFLGLFIPLISSVVPIKRALSQTLTDSLDTTHSKTKAVKVTIERSQDGMISLSSLLVGISLVFFGFLIVYVVPLALLSGNFSLLLNVFFGLLLGMLIGLILITINLSHSLEKGLSLSLFWWDKAAVGDILRKNLVAHRMRNRKTSLMYAGTIGFIIFILVTAKLQITSFSYGVKQRAGTDIYVQSDAPDALSKSNWLAVDQYLRSLEEVEDIAYSSFDLGAIMGASDTRFSNIGKVFTSPVSLRAVTPNFHSVTGPTFLKVGERDRERGWDLSEQLYSYEGSGQAIIGSAHKVNMGLKDVDDELLLTITIPSGSEPLVKNDARIGSSERATEDSSNDDDETTSSGGGGGGSSGSTDSLFSGTAGSFSSRTIVRRITANSYLDSSPAFLFSKFPSVEYQNALVSFPTLMRLTNGTVQTMDALPIRRAYVKVKDSLSEEERESLVKKMRANLDRGDISVRYVQDRIGPVLRTARLLDLFFSVVTVIAMTLCLFSASSSAYTNIREQVKEIAIMRSLGVGRAMLLRIYVYETFCVILAASLLGVFVGGVMGFTTTIQRALFTLRPVTFTLPVSQLVVILLTSGGVALASAFGPAWRVSKQSIVSTMRET